MAESAAAKAQQMGQDVHELVISYVLRGHAPTHRIGAVRQSRLDNWDITGHDLDAPEPVTIADTVIVIGGHHGTLRTCNWARIAKKPILPVVRGRGAAEQIYHVERMSIGSRTQPAEDFTNRYEVLSDIGEFPNQFAAKVIQLAEIAVTPTTAFVIMSFENTPQLRDVYDVFQTICKDYSPSYKCVRVDQHHDCERITDKILSSIAASAFCFADLSNSRPNVYFELGYAKGINRPVVLTAPKGTELPFDIKDYPVLFYDSMTTLRQDLLKRLDPIAEMQGRSRSQRS